MRKSLGRIKRKIPKGVKGTQKNKRTKGKKGKKRTKQRTKKIIKKRTKKRTEEIIKRNRNMRGGADSGEPVWGSLAEMREPDAVVSSPVTRNLFKGFEYNQEDRRAADGAKRVWMAYAEEESPANKWWIGQVERKIERNPRLMRDLEIIFDWVAGGNETAVLEDINLRLAPVLDEKEIDPEVWGRTLTKLELGPELGLVEFMYLMYDAVNDSFGWDKQMDRRLLVMPRYKDYAPQTSEDEVRMR